MTGRRDQLYQNSVSSGSAKKSRCAADVLLDSGGVGVVVSHDLGSREYVQGGVGDKSSINPGPALILVSMTCPL